MKIKFNSDDNSPLKKPLKFRLMTIIIRSVFEEGSKFYPQLFLHNTLYGLDVSIFFINFLVYIEMSEITNSPYYQRNRDLILN